MPSSFSPASVTFFALRRSSVVRFLSGASSFSPASVTSVKPRNTSTTGLPGRLSSRVTTPPSFSTSAAALSSASSARAGALSTSAAILHSMNRAIDRPPVSRNGIVSITSDLTPR